MSNKHYTLELTIQRQMFYDEDSMFGIYSCKPVYYNTEVINKYGTVSIQGNSRRLAVGESYEIEFEGAYTHPKYGDFYKIVQVEAESLTTVTDQDKFLKAILADNYFQSLKKAYPNELLVDLILEDKIDTSKTKGIKQKTLAKIKADVEKNAGLGVLIAKLDELKLSTKAVDKILQHFKNADLALKAVEENIYSLCKVKTFGFITVDEAAMRRGDHPENANRIKACINYLLERDNSEGHTWSIKNDIINKAIDLLNVHGELVIDTINNLNTHDYYITDERIAFKRIYNKEKSIYEHLNRIQKGYQPPDLKFVENNLREIEMYQGFTFTDEQRNAIIQGSQHAVMILNGRAGAGKTATVKGLIDSLGYPSYHSCALSGKASQILLNRGISSSTIHRMLKWSGEHGGFEHNDENPLGYDLIVIDEVSMVNADLFLKVIQAVKTGAKIIIVGDSGQLPSIGYGDCLRDLLATNAFPKFELTKVHRQAAKSGILLLANEIREGNQITPYNSSGKEVYGQLQDQTAISYSNKDQIYFDILGIARSYKSKIHTPEDLLNFQVVVPVRERGALSVRNLNIAMQEIFNNLEKPALSRNGYDYRAGDKVLSNGNSYEQKVFEDDFEYYDYLDAKGTEMEIEPRTTDVYNGTTGYIVDIHISSKTAFIQFEGIDGIVPILQNDLDKIDLCYATTVHKMQGSACKHLVIGLDYGAFKLLSRQLVYTAITRASEKCVILFENNAMHSAIKNDASEIRQTFLGDIIRENSK